MNVYTLEEQEAIRNAFGKNLSDIMYEKHISQTKMANELKTPKTTISGWINGKRIPRAASIEKVCKYLNCSQADLFKIRKLSNAISENNGDKTNTFNLSSEAMIADKIAGMELMYLSEGQELKDIQFPADEIIRARETGALGEMLPSGTEFPVTFANGERNVLVVCRDREHTYLVTKYIMAEPFTMNDDWTNEGGWPACGMREHVQGIYDMLPENIRKVVIPTRIRQNVWDNECEDPAFLLSAVNVFGEKARYLENDCGDTQIDIFQKPADRVKRRLGASGASWWWLRSVYNYYCFSSVNSAGSDYACCPNSEGGVVIAFCIETRS